MSVGWFSVSPVSRFFLRFSFLSISFLPSQNFANTAVGNLKSPGSPFTFSPDPEKSEKHQVNGQMSLHALVGSQYLNIVLLKLYGSHRILMG